MKKFSFLAAMALLATLIAGYGAPARADDAFPRVLMNGEGLISELRLGFLWHDLDEGGRRVEDGHNINGEVLFARPDFKIDNGFLHYVFTPRPHLGASINTAGETSQFYGGVSWDIYLLGPIFLEASLGGAVHTGKISGSSPFRHNYGCRVMFRESASIGIDMSEHVRLMATVDHISHAGLCGDQNPGLTNAGFRMGYTF